MQELLPISGAPLMVATYSLNPNYGVPLVVLKRLRLPREVFPMLQRWPPFIGWPTSEATSFLLTFTSYVSVNPCQSHSPQVFSPSADLWRISSEFMRSLPEWLDGPFTEIDAETVAADVDRW